MFEQALRDIFTSDTIKFLLNGLALSVGVSVGVVLASLAVGTVLGLCRNYGPRPIRLITGAYVEIFRNTPLLLWILACLFMLKFGTFLTRGTFAFVLYTSSVMAEIVRGGLNSIPAGQFEAAASQGFTQVQTMINIVLPQTFLRIIPSLMSQIVTTVKDTSFLSQFAIYEFFYRAKLILNQLPARTGGGVGLIHVFLLFAFVAFMYFCVNFTLSTLARRIRKRGI